MSRSILDYYSIVHPVEIIRQSKPYTPPEVSTVKGHKLLDNAKTITLAHEDPDTKDYITAHKIKDYRRRRYLITLLPNTSVLYDTLLEGSSYWHEKLSPTSINTGY